MRRFLLLAVSICALPAAAQEVVPGADAPEADAPSASVVATPAAPPTAAEPGAQAQTPAEPARPLIMAPIRRAADGAPAVLSPPTAAKTRRAFATAGEHKDFSRVVVNGAEASVGQSGRTVTIALGDADTPDIAALRVRRSPRVASARTVATNDGSKIILDLACDCRARTMRLPDGRVVVDIYNAAPAAKASKAESQSSPTEPAATRAAAVTTPADRAIMSSGAVVSAPPAKADKVSVDEARKRMVALLQQAADDGLIAVKPGARELTPRAEASAPTTPTRALIPSKPAPNASTAAADDARVDLQPRPVPAPSPPPPTRGSYACLPDPAFAIDGRGFKDDPLGAIADLQKQLQDAEVDRERDISMKLALGYLSIGFGEEAIEALADIGEERSLYADLARVIAGKKPAADGLLMGASSCRGAHALWQAAAQDPATAAVTASLAGDAIAALPIRLRGVVATKLAQNLLRARNYAGARRYLNVAVKAAGRTPDLRFIEARLLAEEGKPGESEALLEDLSATNTQSAKDALGVLSQRAADAGDASETVAEDLGALAKAARGTPDEGRAALREAEYWAEHGSVEAGVFLLRDAARRDPSIAADAAAKARQTIVAGLASDKPKQRLAALSAYLQDRAFIQTGGGDATLAEMAAETAVALGVPNAAVSIYRTAPSSASSPAAVARAALAAGAAEEALAAAAPYADQPAFADIVVRANIAQNRGYAALAAASALPDSADRTRLSAEAAWRARDYATAARAYARIDPAALSEGDAERYAMSAYMAGDKDMPAAAEAVLRDEKSPALARLSPLFAKAKDGGLVERGKASVKAVDDDLKMIEEALGG